MSKLKFKLITLYGIRISIPVNRSPPTDPVLTQTNAVHILTPCFFKIHFNIILPYMTEINRCLFPFYQAIRIGRYRHISSVPYSCKQRPSQSSSDYPSNANYKAPCRAIVAQDGSVGIAGRRGSNPGGGEIFRTSSDRPWGPPSLIYFGYRVIHGGKAAGV
jgi:hypothetical protein